MSSATCPNTILMLTLSYALDPSKGLPVFLLCLPLNSISAYPLHCTNIFPSPSHFFPINHSQVTSEKYFLHFLLCVDYTSSPSKKKQQPMMTGVRCHPTTQCLTKSKPSSMEFMAGINSTKLHFKEDSSKKKS